MNKQELLRSIPSVDRMLQDPVVVSMLDAYPRVVVVEGIRTVLSEIRDAVREGHYDSDISPGSIAPLVLRYIEKVLSPSLAPAINATGVILHTGLGRAVLPEAAVQAIVAVASGHCTLEIDRETGHRGSRMSHVEPLLVQLTGAEAAAVYNNNAAAVFLAINTMAEGREVIISRGQLVEIGGAFRVPDIISKAGCRLVEVGTTNRTRISDYADAITENTALILRVHPSNFKIIGFSEEASLEELVDLGKERNVPVMDDLGSGALLDLSEYGVKDEPIVQSSVKAGCDIVTFSGDKLLGSAQAGLVVGSQDAVESCKRNPIARAVRLDKMTLAALEATLKLYLDPDLAIRSIPTLRAITRTTDDIRRQALRLAGRLRKIAGDNLEISVMESISEVGGGSLPGQSLKSWVITLKSRRVSADDLSRHFRLNAIPVFGRIESGLFMLDVRTVAPPEEPVIVECVEKLVRR